MPILRRAEEDYIDEERPGPRGGLGQDEAWGKRRPRSRKERVTGGPDTRRRPKARRIPEARTISMVMRRFREWRRSWARKSPK